MNPTEHPKRSRRDSYFANHGKRYRWPFKRPQAPVLTTCESGLANSSVAPACYSVLEAFEVGKIHFGYSGGPLIFLDQARRSASESPYRHPGEVYRLIKVLHGLALQWREGAGRLGTSWELAFQPFGFEYRPRISQTAEGRFPGEYYHLYEGKRRLFEQHVTKGGKSKNNCVSLYFYLDVERLCVAIGRCGNHPSNTSS